jgi:DNA-directed RNA polymerase specialized sigma24 family protein
MDERLEQLVREVLKHIPQTETWESALTRLLDEILRSRKVCRSFRGQPLFGVYQEMYEKIREQLFSEIIQQLHSYDPLPGTVRQWANNLRDRTCKQVLEDTQLKRLAIAAQNYPPDSELRHYALGELVEAIRLSGRLCRPQRGRFYPQYYDLIYDEAVNRTLIYVCQKIETYEPERGNKKFMNWVNFRLERTFIETGYEFREPRHMDLPSLAQLETMVQSQESASLLERICEYLEEDADNLFKQAHIRNRPDANFSAITLARLAGKTWEEISAELGIAVPTLSSFFQRHCQKFRALIRKATI